MTPENEAHAIAAAMSAPPLPPAAVDLLRRLKCPTARRQEQGHPLGIEDPVMRARVRVLLAASEAEKETA